MYEVRSRNLLDTTLTISDEIFLAPEIQMLDSVSGQKKCPKCKQKGLDQDWESRHDPADILISIESCKDVLFDVLSEKRHL